MKAFDLMVQDILKELKEAPKLKGITFVSAYGRKPFESPVKEPIAAVGTDGVLCDVKGGALSERIQKEKRLTIAVDLFSPLSLGGEACAGTLAKIAQELERGGDRTQHRKIETQSVKYDSNACAFAGSLKLTLMETLHDGESQLEEDVRSIGVTINGSPVFYVRQAQAESENRVYPIECFGENGACYSISRGGEHKVTLGRFLTGESTADIFSLDNFTLCITSGRRNVLFEGCRWQSVEQSFESGRYLTEKAVIRAENRMETEETR